MNDYYFNMLYRRRPGPFGTPPFGIRPGRRPFDFGPPSGGPRQQEPSGPPPSFTPQRQPELFAIDPGAIRRCIYQFVYLWLEDGREFWAYLVFVGRTSIAGFRWDRRRRRWIYFGTDVRNISSFQCF